MSILRKAVVVATVLAAAPASADTDLTITPSSWKIIRRESGPVNYYSTGSDADGTPYVRARYLPPTKTAVLGWETPGAERRHAKKLRWTWRAVTLPTSGDECVASVNDSAAVVYVTWKRGLRYYTLKYTWSGVGAKGRTCDQKRNPFVAQDTIILESGAPLMEWRSEEIDLASEFRRHFENGDPHADVPDFVGVGIMTDGDQTNSASAADYGTFVVTR
jgi:hypothetical protein